ncbi:MAG: MATE family efflux transporter [Eubacteriales bacterium]|nr:MATE family efflux transporter [Eubacteriales bacterium]
MEQSRNEQLGTMPIPKLMVSLAIPAVIAQLINVLYNIVDRMYIGHIEDIGHIALTGVGLTFPILMLISAFSAFIGAGGAPLSAIALGKGDKERAEKILGNGVSVLLVFSVVLTIFFMIFKRPLLYMFGASDQTIVYAENYITIYLIGTIFVQFALGLNMFISSQGQAKIAMLSVLIGAVTNIILDPVFIFVFHMNVRGAALATIISQALSAVWVVRFLLSKKSVIRIRKKNLRPDFRIIGSVMALGISPFIMQATESAINIVLNRGLQTYGGDLYVGTMTILQSVMQLIVVPVQGFTQGVQPIISYNFGARKFDRVKKTYRLAIGFTFVVATVACLCTVSFPTVFARIFTSNGDLIALIAKVMPIFMSGIWIFGIQMGCQTTFMGLGQAKISLFIALLRKVILLIPLAIILPRFFGVMGIYYAEPVSDITAAATAGIIFLCVRKKIVSEEALAKLN